MFSLELGTGRAFTNPHSFEKASGRYGAYCEVAAARAVYLLPPGPCSGAGKNRSSRTSSTASQEMEPLARPRERLVHIGGFQYPEAAHVLLGLGVWPIGDGHRTIRLLPHHLCVAGLGNAAQANFLTPAAIISLIAWLVDFGN